MIRLRWTPSRVVRALILSLAGVAGVVAALPLIGRTWGALYATLLPRLGDTSGIGWHAIEVGTLLRIEVPHPLMEGPWPGVTHFLAVGGIAAGMIALSLLLPGRWLPIRYFLRFVAAIQVVALGYFAFADPPFPYPLPGYIGGLLAAGMAVMALIPLALGFGFYIFDHTLPRQILISVLILVHLAVLVPLQGLMHALTIRHLSLLVQPTLFFVFGLLVEVLVLVGFYGWAMSWSGTEIPQTTGDGRGGFAR